MNIKDLKNLSDINNVEEIVIDGEIYDVDELTQRVLTVNGAQPSDYEDWQHVNVLVQLRNKKEGAKGYSQTNYRYDDLNDLSKFHEHQYPYKLPVIMADAADKAGKVSQIILYADFANVEELKFVPRNQSQNQTQPNKPKV